HPGRPLGTARGVLCRGPPGSAREPDDRCRAWLLCVVRPAGVRPARTAAVHHPRVHRRAVPRRGAGTGPGVRPPAVRGPADDPPRVPGRPAGHPPVLRRHGPTPPAPRTPCRAVPRLGSHALRTRGPTARAGGRGVLRTAGENRAADVPGSTRT